MKIWITWHREITFHSKLKIKEKIFNFLDNFIKEKNIYLSLIEFNLGGANWVDNWIWEYCLQNNIKYNLYLPFKNINLQIKDWTSKQKILYKKILNSNLVNSIYYWKGYFDRNRKIVDNSDIIITVFNWNYHSWTWYTLNYAKKQNKPIINILKK